MAELEYLTVRYGNPCLICTTADTVPDVSTAVVTAMAQIVREREATLCDEHAPMFEGLLTSAIDRWNREHGEAPTVTQRID